MSRAATVPKIGLRATSGKRTLRFGMVNVGISMAPALDDSARVAGKFVDPESHTPVRQQYVNDAGDVVKPIRAYPYGSQYVVMEADDVEKLDGESVIELVANLPLADLPSEWIEKTYLAWPQDATQDSGYALLSHYLRLNARALIGTTVANGTTKAFAIRWSNEYRTLVAQLLAYHAQVRWENVDLVATGIEAIADPDPTWMQMAQTIFDGLDSDFAWDEVEDEYGQSLRQAIEDRATGKILTPSDASAQGVPLPAGPDDLLAALQASLATTATSGDRKGVPA